MEASILLWIQDNLRTPFFDYIFKFFSLIGDIGFIWILMIIVFLIFSKTRKRGLICAISLIISFVLNNIIIKNLVNRIRPYEVIKGLNLIILPEIDSSFPSGHSAASFVCAVVIFLTFPKKYGIPAIILAFLISFSRLYVGVHYPTDVIFGMLSGALIGIICVYISKKISNKKIR